MLKTVQETIDKNSLVTSGDKIIIGVSGGPDSIALLHCLHRLKDVYDLTLVGAHINHGVRGEDALKDELYAKEFCENLGIAFHAIRVNIEDIAQEKKISSEMAGREVRYQFFDELVEQYSANKIALAHHANDLAETVLMRIMRGTGIEGLIGMQYIREGVYIRPLLDISRKEIEEYCEKHQLNPRIDKTNLETIYSRNKVRLELIPYMEKHFNKDIVSTLTRLSDTAKEDSDYLEMQAEKYFKQYCTVESNEIDIMQDAFELHYAITSRVIRRALVQILGSTYNFEKKHINQVIELQKGMSGRKINLPKSIIAYNSYGRIKIGLNDRENIPRDNVEFQYILNVGEKNIIESEGVSVNISVIDNTDKIGLKSKNSKEEYFDFDKVQGHIIYRHRQEGDIINPIGMKGYKKLKKLFNECKIPASSRAMVPIICFEDEIAWVVDCKSSDKFKVTNKTKRLLKIEIEGEKTSDER